MPPRRLSRHCHADFGDAARHEVPPRLPRSSAGVVGRGLILHLATCRIYWPLGNFYYVLHAAYAFAGIFLRA